MDDPYTTPEEDPFHALPPPLPRHRPTSLLHQWIHDQHTDLPDISEIPQTPSSPRAGTPTNAFLAYPDLGKLTPGDDVDSLYSYDFVDDDDLPNATVIAPAVRQDPVTPRSSKQPKPLLTSSTFRNLNLSFRPTSYPIGLASTPDDTTRTPSPRTSSRLSLFARTSRPSATAVNTARPSFHARSASLSTLPSAMPASSAVSPSKWRPSILGHFSQSSQSSIAPPEIAYTPPRPSLSSGDTYMSGTSTSQTTTSVDSDMPPTPSRPSFLESIRSKNRSSLSIFKVNNPLASSSSICSPSRSNVEDIPETGAASTDCLSTGESTLPRRSPLAQKPGRQYDNLLDDDEDLDHYVPLPPKRESTRTSISFASSSTFSRVNFGSLGSKHHRKRKRLVISGVGVHETRKFEGVKQWCESFGEIRQITRVANGDLHIDFRRPEVADTVCRIRAKVFIAGVGSVYLSWTSGDKR